MEIAFDPAKRATTLANRGLDFLDAGELFAGPTFTMVDDRKDYEESRFISVGWLGERMVVVVWVQRGEARRIISMRKANEREQDRFGDRVDRSR